METPPTPPTTEQLRGAWESVADGFDRWVTPQSQAVGERLLDQIGVTDRDRVLDVGAGSGAIALPAARRGARVAAIDVSPTLIQRLGERASDEGLEQIEAHLMDARNLEFGDDSFDAVLSLNGVTMIPDFPRALAEMVRVTRSGGRVTVATLMPPPKTEFIGWVFGALRATVPGFEPPLDPPPPAFRNADPSVFAEAFEHAGAEDVTVTSSEWQMTFDSAQHLWDTFTSSNPIGARIASDLDDEAVTAAHKVLEGMLRERSGGEPGATLTAQLAVGVGTA